MKPIRVFYSELTGKFYATANYKVVDRENGGETVICTGEKFDVTQDIARIIVANNIEFEPVSEENDDGSAEE